MSGSVLALAAFATIPVLAACTASSHVTAGPGTATSVRGSASGTASRPAPAATAPATPDRTAATVTPLVVPASERAAAAAHNLRVVSTRYWSPALGRERRVIILLPAAYGSRRSTRYPVVEFLHGHPGGPLDLFTPKKADIEDTASGPGIAAFIGVVPDGNGPLIDDSWWANIPGQSMGTAVTRDLRQWTAAHFRTSDRWSYAGLSTGGYGSAYLPTVDRSPTYGECGLSGFYDSLMPPIPQNYTPTQRIPYTPEAHAADAPPLVFLVYGTSDARTRAQTRAYIGALRRAGHPYTVRTYPGGHGWQVWRRGFADCLRIVVPAP